MLKLIVNNSPVERKLRSAIRIQLDSLKECIRNGEVISAHNMMPLLLRDVEMLINELEIVRNQLEKKKVS